MGVWWNEEYIYRQPVTIDFSTVTTSTSDVTITVPPDWDLFWDTIRSDFKDVVLTDSNGTLLDFQRRSANYSTQLLVLEINDLDVAENNCIQQIFLFYGYADESTDHSTTFSTSSPKNGFIHLGAPLLRIVEGYGLVPTSNQPVQTFVKSTDEEIDVYFSIQGLLASRITEANGRLLFEEITHVFVNSLDSSGTNAVERYDIRETRFMNGYIRVRSKAGSDDTNYALALKVHTTTLQLYDIRCLIKVKDLLPS